MKICLCPVSQCAVSSFAICLAFGGFSAIATTIPVQTWPQWRGPLQNGVAPAADPPISWSETNNIKWKVKIPGEGSATPLVWGNQIFVQTAIPAGKKSEPVKEESKKEEQPAAAERPQPEKGPGEQPGGGFAPGGFGPGRFLAARMLADGDKNKDDKLSKEEFTSLADSWFDKLDTDKTGKLDRDTFAGRFGNIMGPPPEGAPGGRGGGPSRFAGQGFFTATDANKDGNVTRDEFKATFSKWFTEWDTNKSGSIDQSKLLEGLSAALPRPQFGGPGGQGGGPGGRGGGGGQKPTESQQFALLCLDRQTGRVLWQQIAREEVPHEGYRPNDGNFASPSGVTDGEHVFAYFGSRGLYCYDLSGKQKWSKDLGKMRIAMTFGEGSSPALYKDTLVVNWDNEDGSFITALNARTGETRWKEDRDERTSWSTPLIIEHDGKAQAIVAATGKIRSYDLATGKVIWECGGLTRNVIPTPVADNEKVYCLSGFMGNACLAILLGRTGDLTASDAITWTHNKSTPYVPSPLLYGDKLYFFAKNDGIVSCLDTKSGQALIDAERLDDLKGVYASPLGASGRIYLVGRNGAVVVLKQSDKLETLASNTLDEKFDASPIAVGKDLLLRGRQYLYCISEK
jgi:outer membrane protein assembly factor BamB